jgi:hypothetical protein
LEKNVLPKFADPKRAIPTAHHPLPEIPQPALFEHPKPKAETLDKGNLNVTPSPDPTAEQKSETTPVKGQPSKPGIWSRFASASAQWLDRWIPRRRASPMRSAPVQTELALDKVKVMRNDLSENDVEVVAIDKNAGKRIEKPAQGEQAEREQLTANP